MDPLLHDIYSKETSSHLAEIEEYLRKRSGQPAPHPLPESVYRAIHTLSGSSKMAEAKTWNPHHRTLEPGDAKDLRQRAWVDGDRKSRRLPTRFARLRTWSRISTSPPLSSRTNTGFWGDCMSSKTPLIPIFRLHPLIPECPAIVRRLPETASPDAPRVAQAQPAPQAQPVAEAQQ